MSQVWTSIKERLKDELEKQSYLTWIVNTHAAFDDDILTVYSEYEFQRDWLEKQYKDTIFHTVKTITGQTYEIYFEVQPRKSFIESTEDKNYTLQDVDILKKKITELERTVQDLEDRLNRLEKKHFS
ncbi:chromosomal replication initiation ATPase DnaA [Bacillus tianshenii]|uniref:Chromosomal replication initiation ATPase DnaA n=1 Tax=Sutcliffiella tianshenii TaxID=1463404 RepID=A0ABS2NZB9_9BACI|nr:DnaA N-terminal domain-containing protein [Bacillus tianshenii]MBM7620028.1 chromosomal replication initiation ATPase DnaA [Bacillus tianshenii]